MVKWSVPAKKDLKQIHDYIAMIQNTTQETLSKKLLQELKH